MSEKRVVYLFGAGATQGCLSFVGSTVGLLMKDLNPVLLERLRDYITEKHPDHDGLQKLVYGVLDDDTDFEHVLTFLEQSPSSVHRMLAANAREIFKAVLSTEIRRSIEGHEGRVPNDLYRALLDLHAIEGFPETITGLITLNYDGFLEAAIDVTGRHEIEWGLAMTRHHTTSSDCTPLPVVKLHGSFGWVDSFPVQAKSEDDENAPLWIPPGVIKEKQRYPFNVLWGRVRELLDCDILRIIGWNMGPNDWDLISLLFSTRHGNDLRPPYDIELIAGPSTAEQLKKTFPYLGVRSILETERAGEALIGEYLSMSPAGFDRLGPEDQERAIKAAGSGRNWFLEWLKRNLEWAHVNLEIDPGLTGALRVLEEVV